ncbi:hypothetical protein B0H14DRAFT_3135871 [Mycena olivaceomarginata]|nr:hypothetical protein B0H14DRAFT_3135871 [Mycena olivaceomarginata]
MSEKSDMVAQQRQRTWMVQGWLIVFLSHTNLYTTSITSRAARKQCRREWTALGNNPEQLPPQNAHPSNKKIPRPASLSGPVLSKQPIRFPNEQYNTALNSQMGENPFVDYLLEKTGATPPQLTKVDETDMDLLQMRCSDAEVQRDDALEEQDHALEQLTNLRVSLYQALDERNQAMQQVAEWRRAAIGARSLVELMAKQLDD